MLRLVSYLAPNLFEFYSTVGNFWSRVLEVDVQIVQAQFDPLDDPSMLNDCIDVAFVCGLPFVRYGQIAPKQLQAIAAPVMQASRYQNSPVYFSDVIVNAASRWRTFNQLAGTTLCYNDRGSNSGYHLLRYYLMQQQYPHSFFKQALQSGSHQCSIHWVAEGVADCAAIDSTVLEQELRNHPDLARDLRIVATIGPYPMPPIVAATRLGESFIRQLQSSLLKPDERLQRAMQQVHVRQYAIVQNEDYTPISQTDIAIKQAGYAAIG